MSCARDDDRTDERDTGDRVRRRHQRRVQQRRHARDHLVSEKRRAGKNVKRGNVICRVLHQFHWRLIIGAFSAAATRWFTTSPPCVTQDGPTTSSFMLTSNCPSLISGDRNDVMLRE